jgi:YVTN family beta-propeller protein
MDRVTTMGGRALRIVPLALLLAAACAPQLSSDPPSSEPRSYRPVLESNGELHLYLQPFPTEARRLSLRVGAIAAIRSDGGLLPLLKSPAELRGAELVSAQKRLAAAVLPPGLYSGLSIQIATASVAGDQGTVGLLVPSEPVVLEHEFTVTRRRASALFISLGVETMEDVASRLTPVLSLAEPTRQLTGMLGFATVPARNLVFVFNKHNMQVVDAIATRSGPKGAALDQRTGTVFIASSGDDAIEIIDAITKQILGHIRLTAGDEPREIVLSPDGRTLVSANYGSNTASVIDTGSRREIVRLPLPSRPTDVVVDTSRPRVYILQPQSNAVSVIDFQRRRLVGTGTLEESPIQGALSEDGSSLYLITGNSPNLLVLDTGSLALTARIYVGSGAASIKVDPRTGYIYVGRRSRDIVVVEPRSLMFIDEFSVDGTAAFLTIDNEQSALFVVLPERGLIQKLDLVSNKVLGTLEVERGSYAAVIMSER